MDARQGAAKVARACAWAVCVGFALGRVHAIGGDARVGASSLAQGSHTLAGLVVDPGDGTLRTVCVDLGGPERTGTELLRASGLSLVAEVTPIGTQVCSIAGEGCAYPDEPCLCRCVDLGADCVYWSYNILEDGAWAYAQLGPDARVVRPGDVDGWAWGRGSVAAGAAPPVRTFEDICAARLAPTARATPTRRPSATPRPSRTPRPSPTPRATRTPRPGRTESTRGPRATTTPLDGDALPGPGGGTPIAATALGGTAADAAAATSRHATLVALAGELAAYGTARAALVATATTVAATAMQPMRAAPSAVVAASSAARTAPPAPAAAPRPSPTRAAAAEGLPEPTRGGGAAAFVAVLAVLGLAWLWARRR